MRSRSTDTRRVRRTTPSRCWRAAPPSAAWHSSCGARAGHATARRRLRPGHDHARAGARGRAGRQLHRHRPRAVADRACRRPRHAKGSSDIAFEVASIYELPFADGELRRRPLARGLRAPRAPRGGARRAAARAPPGRCARRLQLRLGRCAASTRAATTSSSRCARTCRCGGRPAAIRTPGARLPAWVEAAGFVDAHVTREHHVDMPYRAFARYIGSRIEAAVRGRVGSRARRAARRRRGRTPLGDGRGRHAQPALDGRARPTTLETGEARPQGTRKASSPRRR